MNRLFRRILLYIILLTGFSSLYGENIKAMEFKNQSISDILLVLGEISNNSIVPDETVKGNASYYFSDTDFDTALSLFLSSYNYYYRVENNVYYVSRIKVSTNEEGGTYSLDAEDTDIQLIVRALSRKIGKTILFDALPRETISIHCDSLPIDTILDIVIKKYADYSLEKEDGFYYIRKEVPQSSGGRTSPRSNLFTEMNGLYSSSFKQVRFKEALESLFKLADLEYSFLGRNDSIIEKFNFTDKSFDQILRLLLEQGNGDYSIVDDIYYIIDIERRDILKKLYTTVYLPLEHTTTAEVQALIPSSLGSFQNIKIDKSKNAFILSGTLEEVAPLQKFIATLDKEHAGMEYHRFQLFNLEASTISGLIPKELQFGQPVILKESNSFIMLLPQESISSLANYLQLIDIKSNIYSIVLKYIKGEDLLENPPPSVKKDELLKTNNPNILYFKGSEKRYKALLKDLELLDRPIPQIRYEVLVMQIQESDGLNWDLDFEAGTGSTVASENSFLGKIGNLLSMNFDIVSQFGLNFAIDLSMSMTDSESKVMADTSLNALSGEKTHFQNTVTYRYNEYETDPDDDSSSTGVTREITSGLTVDIEGWTSGDGMITIDVEASISKMTETTTIPITTERVVTSHIRTESGKPIIIGGLMQQDSSIGHDKTPGLGDIPGIGNLFKSTTKSFQNTEMVITIVPYLEYPEYSISDVERDIEDLYNRFVRR